MADALDALEGFELLADAQLIVGTAVQAAVNDFDGLEKAARRARFPHLAEASLAQAFQ